MKILNEKTNEIMICTIEGEININTSPELRKIFEGFIRNNEKKVIVDFTSVSYIDSSGLATLIEMFQRLKKIGGHMRLANMSQKTKYLVF